MCVAEKIPFADPAADTALLRADILEAVARVIDAGAYILGPEVRRFEISLAKSIGLPGTVGVGSGTDALVLALLAAGVERGDEVITVSHTAGPTVAAIRMIGAVPVLIDIVPDTFCMDMSLVEQAITPATKAIIVVHLYGHPADVASLPLIVRDRKIAIIEDCAQAQGASYYGRAVGSIGDLACFSFYPTKNLGAIGDGGAVGARSETTLGRIRQLRTYGWSRPQFATRENGRCTRLDEVQAAILSLKLCKLVDFVERRRLLAHRYSVGLQGLPVILPVETQDCRHAYHLFVLRTERRDELERYLADLGISTGRHYPFPIHCQPGLSANSRIASSMRVTERVSREILSLPLFLTMTDKQQNRVIASIRQFFE